MVSFYLPTDRDTVEPLLSYLYVAVPIYCLLIYLLVYLVYIPLYLSVSFL